jgi:FkbM family methyltransferase
MLISRTAAVRTAVRIRALRTWALGPSAEASADFPHEPELVRIVCALAKTGGTCADVGANVGAVTVPLARAIGAEGRAIAFEPHPANCAELKRTLRQKRLSWVKVEPVAVSDGSTNKVALYSGRGGAQAEWNITGQTVAGEQGAFELRVRAVSLDGYFSTARTLDLVKIDVEGAEGLVLSGMKGLLARARPIVVVEFHDDANWQQRTVLLEAAYILFDLSGSSIPAEAEREYHVVALPSERAEELRRVAWPVA